VLKSACALLVHCRKRASEAAQAGPKLLPAPQQQQQRTAQHQQQQQPAGAGGEAGAGAAAKLAVMQQQQMPWVLPQGLQQQQAGARRWACADAGGRQQQQRSSRRLILRKKKMLVLRGTSAMLTSSGPGWHALLVPVLLARAGAGAMGPQARGLMHLLQLLGQLLGQVPSCCLMQRTALDLPTPVVLAQQQQQGQQRQLRAGVAPPQQQQQGLQQVPRGLRRATGLTLSLRALGACTPG
jgi:hypothetical protein